MTVNTPLEGQATARLRALALATLALTICAIGIYCWRLEVSTTHLQHDTQRQVEQRVSTLAGAVAGQTEAMIQLVDFALQHLCDEYEDGRSIANDARSIFRNFSADTVKNIEVIDADGYRSWSSSGTPTHTYLGEREYFRVLRNSTADQLFISHPVWDRATGAWLIHLSRPIQRQGKFVGVMVVALSPRYFADSHNSLDPHPQNVISLFRSDGAYLARTPNLTTALGKTVPASRPFIGPHARQQGIFHAVAAFDQIKRIYAWRRGTHYPIVVTVGIDEAAALLPVQQESQDGWQRALAGSALVLALASIVSLLLLRAARQQQFLAASEKRYRSFFQKNTSVKLVINPADGMIVDANPAAAAYYGYTREQLLGMGMANIDCLPVEALLAEMHAAQTEQRTYFNLRHRLASGEERDVEVYAGPVEIEGKTLIFAIIHDVTTRHELERRLSASEELHRSLFLTIAEGVVVINGDGEITSWNSAALSILGVSADALQTRRSVLLDANGEALAPHDYPSRQAARGEHLTQALFGVAKADGSRTWLLCNSRPLLAASHAYAGVAVLSFADITQLVDAEESLRLAQSVFEVAGEGIMVTNAENRIIAVNPAFSLLTGYEPHDIIGQMPSVLASGQHDAAFYAEMWHHIQHDGHWEGEVYNRRKDGSLFVEWLRITVVPERRGHGRRHVAMFSDITSLKHEAETVWRQANFDGLTGLANRKRLEDRLKNAIAQAARKQAIVALLFIDLDRFKPVNDQYGHATGDALLRQVAQRLEHSLREEDTIARLGGDEFVVVLPDLEQTDSPAVVAQKIVSVLSQPFKIDDNLIDISCSIGISLFPEDASTAEALIARADAAMYQAKQAGRGNWRCASHDTTAGCEDVPA